MNWTIEQLRSFVMSAEKGSFSAAARAMGRAQSVVSTHIAMLEDSLGVELFDRSSRSPVLTEAGRDLLPEANAVLRQSHRFNSCAIAQFKGDAVKLDISIGHSVSFQSISETIAVLSRRFPFLSGSVHIESLEDVWQHVEEGRSQIGIVMGELPQLRNNCEMLCLGQIRYCLVAAKDSPLAALKTVTRQDLTQYPQIVFNRSHAEDRLLSSQCWEVNDVFMAMYWASLGIGWTAVPVGLAQRIAQEGSMKELAILNMEMLDMTAANIYLLWNLSFPRRDVLEAFRQELKERYQRLFAAGNSFF
ncbi:MAG: LysR family transcriptional regulator [Mailhella sp.]|nr:LysR family transcriptional regulator [Mailhella sp.]